MLLDPVDWAFVIGGIVLCVRAWRLARDARKILPQENQVTSRARLSWSRVLFGGACIYAVALLGFVGTSRYQASTYLLQPGVDPKREQEALLALNQGITLADKEDLTGAEQSWQRSLLIWEELTKHRSAPSVYRINLALTLCNLGWVNHRSNHLDKAEEYYARAVAVGDELREAPELDLEMKQTLNNAREMLVALRSGKAAPLLEQKDQAARAKFEEAQVKEQKGEVEAENLFAEAVALWEEILPQATNEEYQKYAFSRLASGLLHLGDLQDRLGKRSAAETSLKKAIEYGEKAVTLDPNRPLLKHNLEVAKNLLDGLHDRAMQEEIAKLCKTDRFADAFDLCLRSVEEQEEQLLSGKDHDVAALRLAYRLDRFAWFLAHCPDQRVRDTKAAVKKARRATELQPSIADYWYTLAMVQYRNGDWQDSLASVEKVKAKEGGLDANGWFLSAMNLHQLKQRNDARAAFRKADEWIEERKRQGEENALLRFQYVGSNSSAKEAIKVGFDYFKANASRVSASIKPGDHDYHLHVVELHNTGPTTAMTLAAFVALCSAVFGKPVQQQMVVLGSMSLGGSIISVENLAECLQVAFDSGAKRLLLPMASVGDIPSIPGELFAKFQTGFYADPVDAVFKALGVQ
jgi:tetratricopeptide (TPR) repeat protein